MSSTTVKLVFFGGFALPHVIRHHNIVHHKINNSRQERNTKAGQLIIPDLGPIYMENAPPVFLFRVKQEFCSKLHLMHLGRIQPFL